MEQEIQKKLKELSNKKNNHVILGQSDYSSSSHKNDRSRTELKANQEAILIQRDELDRDMDLNVQTWTLDFMNLVFGRG